MKSTFRKTHAVLFAMFASFALSQSLRAQSLGDIAKQQREKNKQQATTTNKVLTNEDISAHTDSADSASDHSQQKNATKKKSSPREDFKKDDAPSAEELKAAIQEKKDAIAEIQERITKLQSTINYVQNNRNIYTNAPEYNEAQKRKEQEVNRLKAILQEQQDELKELQETARKAGYGSAVYD